MASQSLCIVSMLDDGNKILLWTEFKTSTAFYEEENWFLAIEILLFKWKWNNSEIFF